MRIGIWLNADGSSLDDIRESATAAVRAGYDSVWLGELGTGWDPLTLLAALGPQPSGVELATAIVRSYPRHPLALAAQALTTHAAVDSRLLLGLGPAHAPVIESQYGMSFERPAAYAREYLNALVPLLAGQAVEAEGERVVARGQLTGFGSAVVQPPPVLLSALGPGMLRIAGELAAGVITTWAGPRMLEAELLPRLRSAAQRAGRPSPRVVAQVAVWLTDRPDEARDWVNQQLGAAAELPSYRAVFDYEGYASTADAAVIGDQAAVGARLRGFEDVGVTDLLVTPVGPEDAAARTRDAVPTLLGGRSSPASPASP